MVFMSTHHCPRVIAIMDNGYNARLAFTSVWVSESSNEIRSPPFRPFSSFFPATVNYATLSRELVHETLSTARFRLLTSNSRQAKRDQVRSRFEDLLSFLHLSFVTSVFSILCTRSYESVARENWTKKKKNLITNISYIFISQEGDEI